MNDFTLDKVIEKPIFDLFNDLIALSQVVEMKILKSYPIGKRYRRQTCIIEISPNSFAIIYSFRHLVVSGYVFGAELLLRPLLDRVAIIAYLNKGGEEALEVWLKGWKYKERPSIKKMISYVSEPTIDYTKLKIEKHDYLADFMRESVDDLNEVIHPDPIGNYRTAIEEESTGSVGLYSGPTLENHEYVKRVLLTAVGLITSLINELDDVFPEAKRA